MFKSLLSKSAIAILLTSSMSTFAYYPTMSFNESNCAAITKGNLTGCFQNKTDANLNNYQMKVTFIYENGSTTESISNLGAMKPDFLTVISTSSAELEKNKINSVWFSVIKGDANTYQVVPGCSTEFTATSISKSVLSIFKANGNLYCK